MSIAAVDFETFYSNEVTVTKLGVYHYLRHPESDIYLVSISTDTGINYVGHPKAFDWSQIAGPDWTWLSHNAQFDLPVFECLQELGVGNTLSVTAIKDWHDTADLTAFLSLPRSLKEASRHLLNQEISKDTRDAMKGKRWETMTPEFRAEVEAYALKDAENCLNIWLQHGHKWPEHEREISQATRQMALRGVPLDVPGLDLDLDNLEREIWEMGQCIPWKDEPHRDKTKRNKGETAALLSPIFLREEIAKVGLTAPNSFAQDDPEAEKFFDTYAEQYPWIKSVRDLRKAGKHFATLQTMRTRVKSDGWMPYGLKYGGAHTLRDSGDTGLNLQNLPKGIVSGVDIRSKIKAPEGYTLAIVDLSQIEPRVIHWLADDEKTLQYIREIPDLYEAFARSWGLYTDARPLKEIDPKLRFSTKTMALGLQYGMGSKKFADVAGIPPDEAARLTTLYRNRNPKITGLWKKLETPMRRTALENGDKLYEIVLPSGRSLKYREVAIVNGGITAMIPRQGKLMRLGFWGGVLTENLVQSTARDVFMHQCMEIEKAGIPVLMRVHDEAVCLVPEEAARERLNQIISIMSTAPEWAKGLPLSAEGSLSKVYKK